MERQNTLNLLNEASNSKFVTRKKNTVNDPSNANYNVGNVIIYDTGVLKSNLCDYNNAYILVKSDIAIIGYQVTEVVIKNCTLFTKSIIKIVETTIDDAEDLDLFKPMYNHSKYH